jgi:hypothetical protein
MTPQKIQGVSTNFKCVLFISKQRKVHTGMLPEKRGL